MTENHLKALKLHNFKQFETFEAKDFGAFNLIVGDNNTGKTTMLESLVFFGPNYEENYNRLTESIRDLLDRRGLEVQPDAEEDKDVISFYKRNKTIDIKIVFTTSDKKKETLKVSTKKYGDLSKSDWESKNLDPRAEYSDFFVEYSKNGERYIMAQSGYYSPENYKPFINYGESYHNDIIDYYSELTSQSNIPKIELVKDLELFIPKIEDISISTTIIPDSITLLISELKKNKIPLPQYGDGVNKFFRYLLELQICKGKMLMIDEIDTGIHHSKLKKLIKALIVKAKKYEVQIFATTHSLECMEAYNQAVTELANEESENISTDDYKIISLQRINEQEVKSYTYSYDGFHSAVENGTEIR